MKTNQNYLGLAGIVSLDAQLTDKYNALLKLLGEEGMLIQFERFICDSELNDLIGAIEDNLLENKISLPY